MDSFGSIGVSGNPGVEVDTTTPRTPPSVSAQIIATLATEARPIQRFDPLRTQSLRHRVQRESCCPGPIPRWIQLARSSQSFPLAIVSAIRPFAPPRRAYRWRSSPMSLAPRLNCAARSHRPQVQLRQGRTRRRIGRHCRNLQVHAEEAQLGQFRDNFQREDGLFIPACNVRLDFAIHEGPHRIAQRTFIRTE